jgi:F0F1-type ATP synthase assembly protein I
MDRKRLLVGPAQSSSAESSGSAFGSAEVAWSVTSYLLAGMLVWGGLGWLVDRWRGGGPVFLPIGVLVGVAAALYLVHVRTNDLLGTEPLETHRPPVPGGTKTRSDTGYGETPQR